MTVYVCPACGYRTRSVDRPTCTRPLHGEKGDVPMLTDDELHRATRMRIVLPAQTCPGCRLIVAPADLLEALEA